MWSFLRHRNWPKRCAKQAEENHLLVALEIQKERSESQFRRVDDQLRKIHERLDKLEGIR